MSDSGQLPTVVTAAGLQPISPVTLRQMLVTLVAATNPGYTDNLPGTLIEDIASTDVAALSLCDQARIELINSVSPDSANAYLLIKLGQIYGVVLGDATNTSVELVFTVTDDDSNPLAGYAIPKGFVVSDGTYQYQLTDGGVTLSGGVTGNLSAVATQSGTWGVPAHSVTQLVTSVPSGITLIVDNPLPGTPGLAQEDITAYRTRVLRAGLASSQGTTRYLKTLLSNVVGVQDRLISVRQLVTTGQWEVIVGGAADNYAVAGAIFQSLVDILDLVGSTFNVTGITNANPGVVTIDKNHGYSNGQVVVIRGIVGMTALNGVNLTITVVNNKSFSIGIDTTGYPAWVSGGVVTPNFRNVTVDLYDYPDTYQVPFVVPPQQTIQVTMTWNTSETNFVSAATVAQLGAPAIIDYINNIPVGSPFNALDATHAFHVGIETVLPLQFLTRLVFEVIIDGVIVTPDTGTYVYEGDPESYFFADSTSVIIQQG